jgi:hypothetical protein
MRFVNARNRGATAEQHQRHGSEISNNQRGRNIQNRESIVTVEQQQRNEPGVKQPQNQQS